MYESFFGIRQPAFAMRPDPDLIFPTPQHREALASILYAILNRKGFSVLCGETGTGKTTILQAVLRQLPAGELRSSLIINPAVSVAEFLEMVLLNFGIEDIPERKPRQLQRLRRFLQEADQDGVTPVLIVDEAQRLTPEHIEEIRLLTNFGSLQIVLAGQVELERMLDQHNMRQAKQRVSIMASLHPLDASATRDYIAYRWWKAGGADLPFTGDAMGAIAAVSAGIPRLINLLCDRALLAAFAAGQRTVPVSTIRELAAELRLQSVAPERPVVRESSRIRLDSLEDIPARGTAATTAPGTDPAPAAALQPTVTLKEAVGQRPYFRWPRTS